jgi:large subunit ribosomal protein L25
MAELKLTADKRDGTGKGVARKLRSAGRVPGVLYGHGVEPVPLSLDAKDLYHALHTSAGTNVLVDLVVGGDKHLALPREIQQDHIKGQLVHVDFLAVKADETITVDVPFREEGEAPGVKEGGVVEHHIFELHVECLPADVPDEIVADISTFQLGDVLKVGDIVPPKGVSILTDPEETVLAVVVPAVLKTEAELGVPGEELPEGEVPAEAEEGEGEAAAEGEGAPAAEGEGDGEASEGEG